MPAAESSLLNFHLLCACNCAYDILPGACVYTADKDYSPIVNYTTPPRAVCGGDDSSNACLVGENADGIIVAFRGTLPISLNNPSGLLDWLENFFEVPKHAANVPGQVHSGFYDATMSVIDGVAAAVEGLQPDPTKKVYVTGHSLGGAMATIGAYILSQSYHVPIEQVVTFASPKAGDPAFQTGYQAVFHNHLRFENYEDIVPLLPPEAAYIKTLAAVAQLIPDVGKELSDLFKEAEGWDYVAVGLQQFIEEDKHTIISNEPEWSQTLAIVKEIGEDIWNLNFSSFLAAHTVATGGGYYTAVAPVLAAAI